MEDKSQLRPAPHIIFVSIFIPTTSTSPAPHILPMGSAAFNDLQSEADWTRLETCLLHAWEIVTEFRPPKATEQSSYGTRTLRVSEGMVTELELLYSHKSPCVATRLEDNTTPHKATGNEQSYHGTAEAHR